MLPLLPPGVAIPPYCSAKEIAGRDVADAFRDSGCAPDDVPDAAGASAAGPEVGMSPIALSRFRSCSMYWFLIASGLLVIPTAGGAVADAARDTCTEPGPPWGGALAEDERDAEKPLPNPCAG